MWSCLGVPEKALGWSRVPGWDGFYVRGPSSSISSGERFWLLLGTSGEDGELLKVGSGVLWSSGGGGQKSPGVESRRPAALDQHLRGMEESQLCELVLRAALHKR